MFLTVLPYPLHLANIYRNVILLRRRIVEENENILRNLLAFWTLSLIYFSFWKLSVIYLLFWRLSVIYFLFWRLSVIYFLFWRLLSIFCFGHCLSSISCFGNCLLSISCFGHYLSSISCFGDCLSSISCFFIVCLLLLTSRRIEILLSKVVHVLAFHHAVWTQYPSRMLQYAISSIRIEHDFTWCIVAMLYWINKVVNWKLCEVFEFSRYQFYEMLVFHLSLSALNFNGPIPSVLRM